MNEKINLKPMNHPKGVIFYLDKIDSDKENNSSVKSTKKIINLEDIYPLTIVKRRYGGFAIIEGEANFTCVDELQNNEEWHYGDTAELNMKKDWDHINYGIGETIEDAFKNYQKRTNN